MEQAYTDSDHRWGRERLVTAIWVALVISGIPAMAMASTGDGEPSVAMYTATAIGSVMIVAILLTMGLKIAHGLRLVGGERQVRLARQIRVGFGSTFLLAAVTPYVALNFSMAVVVPFIAGAGVIIGAWIWGASQHGDFDSGMTPSSRT